MNNHVLSPEKKKLLQQGVVIPAHPLALNAERKLDEHAQRNLTRYYIAAGAGGIAVGVHGTQFEIRHPSVNLYEKVLALASDEVSKVATAHNFIKVAGIVGPVEQALREAHIALKHGYDMGLLSMGGLKGWTEKEILERVKAVAAEIPVFGFYLQPGVGGRIFSYEFWLQFAEIENVEAIKIAPFNRYQTLDVVRAVCHSSRNEKIALYTGNDDNIIADLLTTYRFEVHGKIVEKQIVGGLLGHWAVWTRSAVQMFQEIRQQKAAGSINYNEWLTRGIAVTDMNAAIFDPAHTFHGCIPGIHEVLRRQGLMQGRWCLNPEEELSEGQMEEIDRVCAAYPDLTDDAFVQQLLAGKQLVQ
jgi:dihydrodipicolinate synthase/N-acetylneuraminate lyase